MITAETKGDQGGLDLGVDEQDWAAVKLLVDELEQELAEHRNHLLFRISVWYMSVRVFKRAETNKLILREPTPRDRQFHRALLSFLKGSGELLLMELRNESSVNPKEIGIRFEDFSASVQELAYSEREHYGDMTEQRRNEILKDAFGQGPGL